MFSRLAQEISLLESDYSDLEVESVGEIGWASSKYSKLALELRDLYARTNSTDTRHEIELLANELAKKQVNDSDKMQAELLESGLKLYALKAQLQKLGMDETKLTQELMQNKAVWLARLERLTHEDDEALIRTNISKRRELQQRLGQIEQLKASQIEKASQGARK
jgi:inorganic pyrophosphatase/exopolyphosphatase